MLWLWLLVGALALLIFVSALLLGLALGSEGRANERARIEMEVCRAERRIHEIARQGFERMLNEARAHGRGD